MGELLREGTVGFGEVYASTVCNRTAWCRCEDLRASKFVQQRGSLFAWSKPISRKELRRVFGYAAPAKDLRSGRLGRGLNRWVHAVQGACDVLATASCAAVESAGRACARRHGHA